MTRVTAIGEAPGKIIITGEHFVVHGALALAAAVDLKVRATGERSQAPLGDAVAAVLRLLDAAP